jgi:hypothetical protein
MYGEIGRRLVGTRHTDAAGSTVGKIIENGGPGRIRAVNLPIQSRMLYLVELRGWVMKWRRSADYGRRMDDPATKVSAPSQKLG